MLGCHGDAVCKAHDDFLDVLFLFTKVVEINGDTQPEQHCNECDGVDEGKSGNGGDGQSAC